MQVTRGKSGDNITFAWIQNRPLVACHSTEKQEYYSLKVKIRDLKNSKKKSCVMISFIMITLTFFFFKPIKENLHI